MNNSHCTQEVIVNFKTGFVTRRNQPFNDSDNLPSSSFKEACWDNRLPEMLPELFKDFEELADLYTWQIRNKPHFLILEMSNNPSMIDFEKSIDPNIFLALSCLN